MTSASNPEKTGALHVDISQPCETWPDIQDSLVHALQLAFKEIAAAGDAEVSLVLADNDFVQNLNRVYRQKDKPTNVLSFPQEEPGMLGDIVLAYETIAKEAEEQKKAFQDHAIHLVVHGLLHLSGHDHEDDAEADEMESRECRILAALGIKNPYES